MSTATWRIGQWLNAVQTTFVGILRVWSVPLVLLLSLASGYTTYYGLSYFITPWIALIVTIAVQSIIVICTLELAGMHWRANALRYASILLSLLVALVVSVSFSYFKFYEFSERDTILIERRNALQSDIDQYLQSLAKLKSTLMAARYQRIEQATREATEAYIGTHPAMRGQYRNQVGKGPFWSYYNDIVEREKSALSQLEESFGVLDRQIAELRDALHAFAFRLNDPTVYEQVLGAFQHLQSAAETLAAAQGMAVIPVPRFDSYAEFSRGITPSFAMWEKVSLFALACAFMVDFFTLVLSYRLEFTAPGPLTEEEKDLAYQGLRQFGEFTINRNDELEFIIEKTELERARRYSDWSRMFVVALLLNRGYLRKLSDKTVEFAPNLYPILTERIKARRLTEAGEPANEDQLAVALRRKHHG